MLVRILVPAEPLGVVEPDAERLDLEVVADHTPELRAGDHHHEDRVDAPSRGEDVVGRLPGSGPRLRGQPDHVPNHLHPLLDRQAEERRALAHGGLERPPQPAGVDALGAVLVLVRPLRRLVEDDHPLERRVGVRVELQQEPVGLPLSVGAPVVERVALGQVELGVDLTTLRLLTEDPQPRLVVEPHRRDDAEGPARPLLLVEQLGDGVPAVLAVVDREHGGLIHGDELAVTQLPVALQVATDGVEQQRVGRGHREGDVQGVLLVELAVDPVAGVTEALDLGVAGEVIRAHDEAVDLVLLLLEHVDGELGRGVGGVHDDVDTPSFDEMYRDAQVCI